MIGPITYFNNGRGGGVVIVLLAAATIATTLSRKPRWLWLYGGFAAGLVAYDVVTMSNRITSVQKELDAAFKDNPFGGMAQMIAYGAQIDVGAVVVALGALAICVGASMLSKAKRMVGA